MLASLIESQFPSEKKCLLELVLAEFAKCHKIYVKEILVSLMDIEEGFNLRNSPFYAFCALLANSKELSGDVSVSPELCILKTCKNIISDRLSKFKPNELFNKKNLEPLVGKSMVLSKQTFFLTSLLQSSDQILVESFMVYLHGREQIRNNDLFILASILFHSSKINMKIHYMNLKLHIFRKIDLLLVTPLSNMNASAVKRESFQLESLGKFFSSEKSDINDQKLLFLKICQHMTSADSKEKGKDHEEKVFLIKHIFVACRDLPAEKIGDMLLYPLLEVTHINNIRPI